MKTSTVEYPFTPLPKFIVAHQMIPANAEDPPLAEKAKAKEKPKAKVQAF